MPDKSKSPPTAEGRQSAPRPTDKSRNRITKAADRSGPEHNPGLQMLTDSSAIAAKHQWMADNRPGPGASELHGFVWALLTASDPYLFLFYPKPDSTWVDYAPEVMTRAAKKLVGFLKQLSKKQSRVALDVLADLATDATIELSRIAKTSPQRLVPVARKRILWPMLTSSMKGFRDDDKEIAKSIELGAVPVISADLLNLKTPRIKSPATRKAVELISAIESQRSSTHTFFVRLPAEWERRAQKAKPFSPETWKDWFEIAWLKVLDDSSGKPEDSEELRPLGKSRANRDRQRFDRSGDASSRLPGSEKDGIKQQLESAFEGLSGARKKIAAPAA